MWFDEIINLIEINAMTTSMTAFTRQHYQNDNYQLTWEIRSLNHRHLDLSFSLPDDFRSIEADAYTLVKKYLSRGKLECYLQYQKTKHNDQLISINQDRLESIKSLQQQLQQQLPNAAPISISDLLNWPNIIDHQDSDSYDSKKQIIDSFEQALLQLINIRKQEGNQLAKLIIARTDTIKQYIEQIKNKLPELIDKQRQKITDLVKQVITHVDQEQIDQHRINQEIILYSQKIDIAEELDRLAIHCQQIEKLLKENDSIGKRLAFLLQECQREANTMTSKVTEPAVVHWIIDIKVIIEQIREQAQNIE